MLSDVDTGEKVRKLPGSGGEQSSIAFSPDGKLLAAGHFHGDISVWEVDTGGTVWRGGVHKHVASVAFSPDGRLLASGGANECNIVYGSHGMVPGRCSGVIKIWDVETGRKVQTIRHTKAVLSVAFQPQPKPQE